MLKQQSEERKVFNFKVDTTPVKKSKPSNFSFKVKETMKDRKIPISIKETGFEYELGSTKPKIKPIDQVIDFGIKKEEQTEETK